MILDAAFKSGIKIILHDNKLRIIFGQNSRVDDVLLSKIKQNKKDIIRYLSNLTNDNFGDEETDEKRCIRGDDNFYEITDTQKYWIDDRIDARYKKSAPMHGTIHLKYSIVGDLNIVALQSAILYLYERHESLRTTFHREGDGFYMKVHRSLTWSIEENYWSREICEEKRDYEITEFENFADHQFFVSLGPLFVARLLTVQKEKHVLSMRIHHVISDMMSEGVLLKDLFNSYSAFSRGVPPNLETISYQYRDYLSLIINHKRENYFKDKDHWSALYSDVPPEFFLPIRRSNVAVDDGEVDTGEVQCFKFDLWLTTSIRKFASKTRTTVFIVLQTLWRAYLHQTTGQSDVLMGTYVYGRDYPGMQSQIGCYAKTVLIRTVLSPGDTLLNVLEKVKQANKHMNDVTAYSLFDYVIEKRRSGIKLRDIWKINIQYTDQSGLSIVESDFLDKSLMSQLKFRSIDAVGNDVLGIDLQIQFYNDIEAIHMNLEFDNSLYTSGDIHLLGQDFINWVTDLVADFFNSHACKFV